MKIMQGEGVNDEQIVQAYRERKIFTLSGPGLSVDLVLNGLGVTQAHFGKFFDLEFEQLDRLPQTWNGPEDGLPPIGLEVEIEHRGCARGTGKVLFYGAERCIIQNTSKGNEREQTGASADYVFRPIRTAEKLAAEEREQQIEKLSIVIHQGFREGKKLADVLYDAGARMPDEGSKS